MPTGANVPMAGNQQKDKTDWPSNDKPSGYELAGIRDPVHGAEDVETQVQAMPDREDAERM